MAIYTKVQSNVVEDSGGASHASQKSFPLFKADTTMRVAALLSGQGTNLRAILNHQQGYEVVMVFTDTADERRCNARQIATEHHLPYYCNDIATFYRKRGHRNRKDMRLREEYDRLTLQLLKAHRIDSVALCGYLSIVSAPIYQHYPTLNVHPADLRILNEQGKRYYAGCIGAQCVTKAISRSESEIRSTIHLVTEDVDGGPIVEVSEPVALLHPVHNEVTALFEAVNAAGRALYPTVLQRLAEGRYWINAKRDTIIHTDLHDMPKIEPTD